MRKIFSAQLVFVILLMFASSVWAEENTELRLNDVIRLAGEQGPQAMLASERVNQAIAKIAQARSSLLPQIDVSASQMRQTIDRRSVGFSIPSSSNTIGPYNVFEAKIRLTQSLFDPASIARLSASFRQRELSAVELEKAKQDVMVLAATLFVQARLEKCHAEVAVKSLERDKIKLQVAQARLDSGQGSTMELKEAEAYYAQSQQLVQSVETQFVEKKSDLLAALGMPLETDINFSEDDTIGELSDIDLTQDETLAEQPDMLSAKAQHELARADYNVERARYLPAVSVFGDYGASGENPSNQGAVYALGVQGKISIWNGGLRSANIDEKESVLKASEISLADTSRQIKGDVLTAMELVKESKRLVYQKQAWLEVAEQQLNDAQKRLEIGSGSDVEVSEYQTKNALAQYEICDAKAMRVLSQINLARALGKMDTLIVKAP